MTHVTLAADEKLIETAREIAQEKQSTLDHEFQLWLESFVQQRPRPNVEKAMATIRELQEVVDTSGRKFTREEMNERGLS